MGMHLECFHVKNASPRPNVAGLERALRAVSTSGVKGRTTRPYPSIVRRGKERKSSVSTRWKGDNITERLGAVEFPIELFRPGREGGHGWWGFLTCDAIVRPTINTAKNPSSKVWKYRHQVKFVGVKISSSDRFWHSPNLHKRSTNLKATPSLSSPTNFVASLTFQPERLIAAKGMHIMHTSTVHQAQSLACDVRAGARAGCVLMISL